MNFTHTDRFGVNRFYVLIKDNKLHIRDDDDRLIVYVPLDEHNLQDAIADTINAVSKQVRASALDDAMEAMRAAISLL
ncbi:hypothetical protein EBZ80_10470 [bacterium]|nr:hypothetical protein [bacterium]